MTSSELHTKIPIAIKIFFDASTLQLLSHITPIIGTALRLKKLQKERNFNGNVPATDNQIGYLKRLGAEIQEGLTKEQASQLIDAILADRN